MATTIHEPPRIETPRTPGSGNGGWRNLVPAASNMRLVQEYAPPPASTGIWVVLAGVTMTFAAFTSALIVRKGGSNDWQGFTLPSILYFNTLLLIASSVTLEISRRRIASFMGGKPTQVDGAGTLALRHIGSRVALCGRAIHGVGEIAFRGVVSCDQSQQLVFLCADGSARATRAGRPRWTAERGR